MRKTRLVILPTKSINHVGFLLLFLSCPVIGDWGRIRPDTEMSHKAILIERAGTCGLEKDDPGILEIFKPDGFFHCQQAEHSNGTKDTSNIAQAESFDSINAPFRSSGTQRRAYVRRIIVRTRDSDRPARSVREIETTKDAVIRSRRERSSSEMNRRLSRERNERFRETSEIKIRREKENAIRRLSLGLVRQEPESRRNSERRSSLGLRERESESEKRISSNIRESGNERIRQDSDFRDRRIQSRRLSGNRREREFRTSQKRQRFEQRLIRSDTERRVPEKRSISNDRERDARASVSRRESVLSERRINDLRTEERRSLRASPERRLINNAERSSEQRRNDQRRLSLARRERENSERIIRIARSAETNKRNSKEGEERRLNLVRSREYREEKIRNNRNIERRLESVERKVTVENRRNENRAMPLDSVRRNTKGSRSGSTVSHIRLDRKIYDKATREITPRIIVTNKPGKTYFHQLEGDEVDLYDGIIPGESNLHDKLTKWIGFQWLQNPTVSKIGDWTVNCALGAAVFYFTSRQVKTN